MSALHRGHWVFFFTHSYKHGEWNTCYSLHFKLIIFSPLLKSSRHIAQFLCLIFGFQVVPHNFFIWTFRGTQFVLFFFIYYIHNHLLQQHTLNGYKNSKITSVIKKAMNQYNTNSISSTIIQVNSKTVSISFEGCRNLSTSITTFPAMRMTNRLK